MSLNRAWNVVVSVVTVAVSLFGADARASEACAIQQTDCLIAASGMGDWRLRMEAENECYNAYHLCVTATDYCGDGYCVGEDCSTCAADCMSNTTTDKGTVSRDCSTALVGLQHFYGQGYQQGPFCMYPTNHVWATTCNVYRLTERHDTCPVSTQETYEATTTTYSTTYYGYYPVSGACR